MSSELAYSTRTPVRIPEPVTLTGKLTLRVEEYDALSNRYYAALDAGNKKLADSLRPAWLLADRRVMWAMRRRNDAEQAIARMGAGHRKSAALCVKLYGQPTIPVGPDVRLYQAGALAYIESGSDGLVPCKVIKVGDDDVMIKITADRDGYAKGVTMVVEARDVFPRNRVVKPNSADYVLNVDFHWVKA